MKTTDPAFDESASDLTIQRFRASADFLTELASRFNSVLPDELAAFARYPFEPLEAMWDQGWETFWSNWFFHGFLPYWASEEIGELPKGLNPFTSLSTSALTFAAPHQAANYEHRLSRSLETTPFTFWQITAIAGPFRCSARSVYFDLNVDLQESTKQLSVGDIIFARVIAPKDILSEGLDTEQAPQELINGQQLCIVAGCAPVLFQPANTEDLHQLQTNLLLLANECCDPDAQLDRLSYDDQRKYDVFLMDLFAELTAELLQPRIGMDPNSLTPILLTYTTPSGTLEILHYLERLRDTHAPLKEDSHGVRELLLRTDNGQPVPAKVVGSEIQILALTSEIEEWIHRELIELFDSQIQLQGSRKLQQHEFEITRAKKDPKQAAND